MMAFALPKELRDASRKLRLDEAQAIVSMRFATMDLRFYPELMKTIPGAVVDHLQGRLADTRYAMDEALDHWALSRDPGIWLRSIKSLPPYVAWGFLALLEVSENIDIELIWKRCGLDPATAWAESRVPLSNPLKVLAIAAGEAMAKQTFSLLTPYGTVYRKCKEAEIARLRKLPHKGVVYSNDARADLVAKRVAVKLFLAHYHQVAFYTAYDRFPDFPWRLLSEIPGKTQVDIPNLEMIPEMAVRAERAQLTNARAQLTHEEAAHGAG